MSAQRMNIHIRSFRPADADAVNLIAVAAYQQYQNVFIDWRESAVFFAETARLAGEVDLLVAEGAGNEILGSVGYVAPGRSREDMFEPDWAVIRRISVTPLAQGRGIGRRLTEECIGRARQDGAPVIALQTSTVMKAALAMYFALGFAHHQNTADCHGVPHAVYTLRLK
jgi:ribosomal protein S18 acetylase RimI-like enzyme